MLFDTVFIVSIARCLSFSCLHELKRDVLNHGNASELDHNILTSMGEGCLFFFFLFHHFFSTTVLIYPTVCNAMTMILSYSLRSMGRVLFLVARERIKAG